MHYLNNSILGRILDFYVQKTILLLKKIEFYVKFESQIKYF
jgi:hypothetical protein